MKINIYKEIERLLSFGLNKNLMAKEDVIYTRNKLLEILKLNDYEIAEVQDENLETPAPILDNILNWCFQNGILESNTPVYRDLLDAKIMDTLVDKPSVVINKFYSLYEKSPSQATDYFYSLSKASDYIRVDRIKKNLEWKAKTDYGDLDITINLSKPEKDPKAIAAARNIKAASYPKCLLCKENEGYAGRLNHPARENHRIIPVKLGGKDWFFQYSPYVYYNEHCIVLNGEHVPMKISKETFDRLLEFTEKFPHYFIGSNADLPIVGGSILSHDHFQGGNYIFPMAKAETERSISFKGFPDIEAGIVKWPMSVLRIKGNSKERISKLSDIILSSWREYSDTTAEIHSHTGDTPHNTITPICRRRESSYEMDLVLRNNRTSKEHPLGIFHPHSEVHNIKKENIGLIEVMGLAVLPARLKDELELLSKYLIDKSLDITKEPDLIKHEEWYKYLINKYDNVNRDNVNQILKQEVGSTFMTVLEHAGVYKRNSKGQAAFIRFINSINS
ncbi:MAG: UDP-glucose--hexose-1-phosphate uridylyltransferase [Bacillota bacterium]|nr:UDP-glucose--hexose-1-phosphate uridylyltransferase [Bacillota bacterium]